MIPCDKFDQGYESRCQTTKLRFLPELLINLLIDLLIIT